ncbi:hypothetical protein DL768_010533 [Monosporascus sp. mg162]|nr:hypothetical protein DL768_010533 [Monosporascus sp. mg162]
MRRSARIQQQLSLQNHTNSKSEQQSNIINANDAASAQGRGKSRKRSNSPSPGDASGVDTTEPDIVEEAAPAAKKKRTARAGARNNASTRQVHALIFGNATPVRSPPGACCLPGRVHLVTYHRPILLDSQEGRASLFKWFDSISNARAMPWRKAWLETAFSGASDASTSRRQLERRAYEVWISEIMLQQTRVAVVIEYWNRWMKKWPTIQDLAAAKPEEVLAAWRGLGYYSRATRIHEAAKLVTSDVGMQGLLPASVEELEAKVPGVGRYTAGAISAIVFGRAAPMVDGNVLRVLSRQLGLFGDVKADKSVVDTLWAAADALVKAVATEVPVGDGRLDMCHEPLVSDRPGRWGQALMELGSTVCTPKPNCAACPINSTCRAYTEGLQLSVQKGLAPEDSAPASIAPEVVDIEDRCKLCKPFEESESGDAGSDITTLDEKPRARKQVLLRSSAFTETAESRGSSRSLSSALNADAMEVIVNHARKFPVKVIRKAVREEENLVCIIRRSDGRYLIHRRPQKGLLAGLWEFPSLILPSTNDSTPETRKKDAAQYISTLSGISGSKAKTSRGAGLKHVGELGSVPWLFSHIKLTMHVHLFELDTINDIANPHVSDPDRPSRWTDTVDEESMGTGMRKCWALVKKAIGSGS